MITEEIPLVSHLNDYRYQAYFYGEPFIEDHIIWYFDGEFLMVSGYDVNLAPVNRARFLVVLESAKKKFDVNRIMFASERLVSIKRPYPEFERTIFSRPKQYGGEIFVTPNSYRSSKSIDATLRRASRRGLRCIQSKKEHSLSLEKWALVSGHIGQFEPTPYYHSEYVVALVGLFQADSSVLFDVYQADSLVGFALANARHPYAVLHLVCLGSDRTFVSDILYHTMIEYFLDLGYQKISLGIGCNPGLYAYKRKWTTHAGTPGLYDVYWEKGDAEDIVDELWFSRLLTQMRT